MQAHAQYGRFNAYHGTKRQLLGNHPGQAAPAWRVNQQAGRKASGSGQKERGSKVLLSSLPYDVSIEEVEALFEKTVGPLKEAFLVHNSQGNSKGMAVVEFQRVADASIARAKYNGKIIDSRRAIKIEIVKDEDDAPVIPPAPRMPSLLERITHSPQSVPQRPPAVPAAPPKQPKKNAAGNAFVTLGSHSIPAHTSASTRATRKSLRTKKGPKRVKKVAKSREQLDKEMEDYRVYSDT